MDGVPENMSGAQKVVKFGKSFEYTLTFPDAGISEIPDALTPFDVLSFTGSADTAASIRTHNAIARDSVRVNIEADSLPFPVRLTEGQATGDIVKISNEQNRRGKDPELAQRFNEQNGQLIENINEIRKRAAPDGGGLFCFPPLI
ncbi:MAG: hypothetical protein EBY22_17915 [Gammaproteobacteria bacterium]|nr:hypothetical protein [Gammaproteobacteria bacterium]